jgi:hypothetical protein
MTTGHDPGSRYGQPYTTSIAEADLKLALRRATRELSLFVAGPYIERNWTSEVKVQKSPAALLRVQIIEHIESTFRHSTVLGEHRGVIDIGNTHYGTRSSVLLTELELVRDANGIIMLPSSPGSFCELGSWVLEDEICRKMLILSDEKHRNPKSYMELGVYKTATDQGAELHWIDYHNVESALKLVSAFVSVTEDREMSRSSRRGR